MCCRFLQQASLISDLLSFVGSGFLFHGSLSDQVQNVGPAMASSSDVRGELLLVCDEVCFGRLTRMPASPWGAEPEYTSVIIYPIWSGNDLEAPARSWRAWPGKGTFGLLCLACCLQNQDVDTRCKMDGWIHGWTVRVATYWIPSQL